MTADHCVLPTAAGTLVFALAGDGICIAFAHGSRRVRYSFLSMSSFFHALERGQAEADVPDVVERLLADLRDFPLPEDEPALYLDEPELCSACGHPDPTTVVLTPDLTPAGCERCSGGT